MPFHVNSQSTFRFKEFFFSTDGAFIFSFLVVGRFVRLQIAFLRKSPATGRTHVRSLTCVNPAVSLKIKFAEKNFQTNFTFVRMGFIVTCFVVSIEGGFA